MPVPKPENVGDIYLIRDYPVNGQSSYGVTYFRDGWKIQMQDGDVWCWDYDIERWDIYDSDDQTLVRRNEWPAGTTRSAYVLMVPGRDEGEEDRPERVYLNERKAEAAAKAHPRKCAYCNTVPLDENEWPKEEP